MAPSIATAQLLLEVPESDRGFEVLRAERVSDDTYRILSVPVLVVGISRGTLVAAAPIPTERLQFVRIHTPSPGATARCYVTPETIARRAYEDHLSGGIAEVLGLGPATLFDPDVVAVHISDRKRLDSVAAYLDRLILAGVLRLWKLTDPGATGTDEAQLATGEWWEVVHPPADPWSPASSPS